MPMVYYNKDKIKIFLDHNAIDILLASKTHFTDTTIFRIPPIITHTSPIIWITPHMQVLEY
jgi:hypothetical protein